jgi:hypothetical protein
MLVAVIPMLPIAMGGKARLDIAMNREIPRKASSSYYLLYLKKGITRFLKGRIRRLSAMRVIIKKV